MTTAHHHHLPATCIAVHSHLVAVSSGGAWGVYDTTNDEWCKVDHALPAAPSASAASEDAASGAQPAPVTSDDDDDEADNEGVDIAGGSTYTSNADAAATVTASANAVGVVQNGDTSKTTATNPHKRQRTTPNTTATHTHTPSADTCVRTIQFAPSGRYLVVAGDNKQLNIYSQRHHQSTAAAATDNTNNTTTVIVNTNHNSHITSAWHCAARIVMGKKITAAAFVSENLLLLADKFGDVYEVELTTTSSSTDGTTAPQLTHSIPRVVLGHLAIVTHIEATSDCQYVCTTDNEGKTRVSHYPEMYDIASMCMGSGGSSHNMCVTAATTITRGNQHLVVTGGLSNALYVFDARSGKQLSVCEVGTATEAYVTSIVSDSRYIFAAVNPSRDIHVLTINDNNVFERHAVWATTGAQSSPKTPVALRMQNGVVYSCDGEQVTAYNTDGTKHRIQPELNAQLHRWMSTQPETKSTASELHELYRNSMQRRQLQTAAAAARQSKRVAAMR